jgi:DNA-binding response OmpR family regulator
VVDRDGKFRSRISALLEKAGFEIECFAAVSEAAGRLKSRNFDLLVINARDVEETLAREIEEFRKISPRMRIIAVSPENSIALESKVRGINPVYYHLKTFPDGELVKAVKSCFERNANMKKRILIVDDDTDYQESMRVILESNGFDVASAFSKEEGQKKVSDENFDLVILDIMMDRCTDGFHFLYELRQSAKKKTPVLSISAISQKSGFQFNPADDEDYFPADGFIEKPVKEKELLEEIKRLTNK